MQAAATPKGVRLLKLEACGQAAWVALAVVVGTTHTISIRVRPRSSVAGIQRISRVELFALVT